MSKSAWTEKDQIDNFLKERRLMRSLEKFVGGRLYEGDLRLRQKNHMILSYDVLIIQDCDEIPKRPTMYLNLRSYKAVRLWYSNPMIQPEPEGSTQGYPLVSVEVLRLLVFFTHPSGSSSVAEKPPSVEKIKHSVTSEGTGLKLGVPDVTKDDSTESESESWGNDEDDSNDESDAASEHSDEENEKDVKDDDEKEEEFIHTPSQSDDENDDEIEGDKDKGMDFVKEAGLNEPVHADEENKFIEVDKSNDTDDTKVTEVLATTSSSHYTWQSKYVVPTGRVVVPTGRYVVPAGKRESKARTTLLQSIPDDHVADFHYMDDARDIWNAVKARFGGNAESKKMRKSMLKQEFSEFRISKAEGLHKGRWDLKWQLAMLSVRVHKFEQKAGRKTDFDKKESVRFNKKKDIGKKKEDSKALIIVDTLVDWTEHDGQSDGVIAPKEFGMIAGCDTEDAIEEGDAKIYNLITGADTKEASTVGDDGEFALMGVTSEVHNCPFGCDNKYNELQKQHNELNEQNSEYFIQVQAYKNSLKTLEKQKRVLQKIQLTLEDKIRVFSIELENTTNLLKHSKRIKAIAETTKKELQTKLDNYFVQIEKWRTSSKNLFRLIDSSMSVRTKVGLGFNNYIRENELGWDNSAFSVFTTNSEKMEEPKSNDSTSCASTSSVSTSESEAEIESNVGTPIQEPIIVQDLPSHFRKNDSSVLKLWFCIVVSSTHLIKDCDFYEIQIWLNKTGKVYIPPARPHPVPTGNLERLDDFQEFQGGKVTFRGGKGRITRKGTIRTPTLDFENVYYVKELQQFNLTSTLPNEVLVVLRVPRKHTHLHLNLNNLSPRLVVKSIQYVFGLEHAIEATSSLDVITLQIWITPVFSSTASMIFCFNDYVQALTSAHFISRLGLLLALRVAIRPRRQDSCNDSGMTMNLGRTIDKQFHGLNAIIEKGGYVECEALSYFSMYMALLNARAVVLLYAYKKYNVSRVDVRSLDVYKFTMTFAYWSSYEDVINDNMQGACQAYDRHVNSKVDPLIGKSVDLLETHLLDLGPYGYSQPSRPMSRLFQNGSTTLDIIRGYANIAGVSAVGNLPDLQRHDMFVTTMVEEWWQAPSCLSSCTYGVYFASRSTKGYSGYDSLVDTIESSQDSPAFHSDLHLIWIRELLKSLTATRSERGGEKSELGGLCMM
ncbi:hypothetical protein Tco_0319310 [Tanacetum coccineum]